MRAAHRTRLHNPRQTGAGPLPTLGGTASGTSDATTVTVVIGNDAYIRPVFVLDDQLQLLLVPIFDIVVASDIVDEDPVTQTDSVQAIDLYDETDQPAALETVDETPYTVTTTATVVLT